MLAIKFITLIQRTKTASVAFCASKCGTSKMSIYNYVKEMQKCGHNIKIENGVIYYKNESKV